MISSRENQLALRAALSPVDEAKLCWIELLKKQEFHKLDLEISRIVPAIYSNLHSNSDLPHIAGLLGVGKRTWANNQRMMVSVVKVLAKTNDINYRLLKGAAILLLDLNLTSRSMGDIDLLVSERDLSEISQVLFDEGFRNEFVNFCPHTRSAFSGPEISFLNQSGTQVDLHIMERHHLRGFFELLLKSPPQLQAYNGEFLKIPKVEYLLAHAIIHGYERVADGDDLQAIVDFHRLLPLIDWSEMNAIIKEIPNTRQISKFLSEEIQRDFKVDIQFKKAEPFQKKALNITYALRHRLRKILKIVQSRAINISDARKAAKDFGHKKGLYLVWLLLGKPRIVERIIFDRFSGFTSSECSSNLGKAGWAQEIRFSVHRNEFAQFLSIRFRSSSLEKTSFLLFRNGILLTTIGGKGSNVDNFEVQLIEEKDEYSLRLGAKCCASCASQFNEISFEITSGVL